MRNILKLCCIVFLFSCENDDFITSPENISTNDTLAILSGMWYYKFRVLDKITVDSTVSVYKLTKYINSTRKGLKDRKKKFKIVKDSITCIE